MQVSFVKCHPGSRRAPVPAQAVRAAACEAALGCVGEAGAEPSLSPALPAPA